jgi:hypothetical protein
MEESIVLARGGIALDETILFDLCLDQTDEHSQIALSDLVSLSLRGRARSVCSQLAASSVPIFR